MKLGRSGTLGVAVAVLLLIGALIARRQKSSMAGGTASDEADATAEAGGTAAGSRRGAKPGALAAKGDVEASSTNGIGNGVGASNEAGSALAGGTASRGTSPLAGANQGAAATGATPGGASPPAAAPPPYRPAKVLTYSEEPPGRSHADDDASAVLKRILDITRADEKQSDQIRALWHAHEDGRRALVAAAPPPSVGAPVLDHDKVGALDFAFESTLLSKVLNPTQRERVVAEAYPATR